MTALHRKVEPQAPAGADAFLPSPPERIARARGDLRLGLPVAVTGEGMASLVLAVEAVTPERHAAARRMGPVALVLSGARAAALGLSAGGGAVMLQTGGMELAALQALADPLRIADLPPLPPALPAPARLAAGLHLAKAAQLLPALLAVPLDQPLSGGLTVLAGAEIEAATAQLSRHLPVSAAALPMAVSQAGRVHVFRPEDGGAEHYAVEVGHPDPAAGPVLVRLHSACFTGDVLGSLKCDCGPQLRAAMAAMAGEGGGVLLYLNQEGRGIGMANKMRAYALQERGLDTVEANLHLGFHDDERDFRIGAALLARMGIGAVRLMTNNPAKVAMLSAQGIRVADRVPLRAGATPQNAGYLATKAAKSGHLLP